MWLTSALIQLSPRKLGQGKGGVLVGNGWPRLQLLRQGPLTPAGSGLPASVGQGTKEGIAG